TPSWLENSRSNRTSQNREEVEPTLHTRVPLDKDIGSEKLYNSVVPATVRGGGADDIWGTPCWLPAEATVGELSVPGGFATLKGSKTQNDKKHSGGDEDNYKVCVGKHEQYSDVGTFGTVVPFHGDDSCL